jgi:hypothetical protein
MPAVQRSREIRYDGVHCTLVIRQPAESIVILTISGSDTGEFGDAPMQALNEWLDGGIPVHLFVDAREVRGASIEVSGEWAQWMGTHRSDLRSIHMLPGSRLVQVTADFVRRFANLEGIMKVYTEPGEFDSALAEVGPTLLSTQSLYRV